MAKEGLNKATKAIIFIGVFGITGVAVWAGHKYIYKPWKAKRDGNIITPPLDTDTGNAGSSSGKTEGTATTSPISTTTTPLTSYEMAKKYFGDTVTVMTDRIFKEFYTGTTKRKVEMYTNGRIYIYSLPLGATSWTTTLKGDYTLGGKKIIVTFGAKKGYVKTNNDIMTNIKNTI